MMRTLLLCFLAFPAWAADTPVGYLQDMKFGYGSSVYAYFDAPTGKRFLVFQVSNGNGGYSVAVVEATPPPRPVVAKPVAPPVERPAPVVDTTSPWELSLTRAPLTAAQIEAGWACYRQEKTGTGVVYYVRRQNPHYVLPKEVEKP